MTSDRLDIRETTPADLPGIATLYAEAFPGEELMPLVGELLQEPCGVLSLAAIAGSALVGHAVFTACGLDAAADGIALVGPLAVAVAWQRRGIGTALLRAGLRRLEEAGVEQACVLGDPAYYGRLGFAAETGIRPPYALPPQWEGAWQSLPLGAAGRPRQGKLRVPRPWRRPALWAP
ncbi:GNAT family N-acetyltransferase [Falsiroseomonas sp.]|uniref:GNAT family N-acetyltransferase n=1 Tax=Falsiroseomonas sp. TaxID=2870721 RepID=UPI003566DE51